MTWTYDSATALGRVRLHIGDTDTTQQLMSDAEVGVYTTLHPNELLAAAACCEALAAKYARQVNTGNGSLSVGAGGRSPAYLAMAATLRKRALREGVGMTVGGVIVSENDTTEADDDLVEPTFTVGMHDGTTTSSDWDE